jgi:hypothetical protein
MWLRESSVDVAALPSHDDSIVNTGDSDSESWSGGSNDTTYESDSSKWVKVAAATAATRITFDFGISNMGRARVVAMETHARYFLKGYYRSSSAETISKPGAERSHAV